MAIVGAVTGSVALSMHSEVTACCDGTVCPADTKGDRSTGQALTITTDFLIPVGAVGAAIGLLLAFVLQEESPAAVAVSAPKEARGW